MKILDIREDVKHLYEKPLETEVSLLDLPQPKIKYRHAIFQDFNLNYLNKYL